MCECAFCWPTSALIKARTAKEGTDQPTTTIVKPGAVSQLSGLLFGGAIKFDGHQVDKVIASANRIRRISIVWELLYKQEHIAPSNQRAYYTLF